MSEQNQKPDLEDSINVTEAHARVEIEAAACAREKRIADNGREPVALWVFVVCGVVFLIAGGVLGGANPFSYGSSFRADYVRASAPGGADEGPQPRDALAAFSTRGARIYSAKCNGCHGGDARGDGANYPSLIASDWVVGDTQKFAMVILNGLQGPTSTGKTYGAGVMPPQSAGMTAEDLAGVMTYLRNNLGNSTGDIVTIEMAQDALDISAKRDNPGQMVTADELVAQHATMLSGDPLDPTTFVNPVSLEPIQ